MFNIVLLEPEIPHNAGAAGRLALATGSSLHLVKPLGFSLEDKYVKRTGLDYWQDVDLHVWENFAEFTEAMAGKRMWFLSTKAKKSPWTAGFEAGDCLVFGKETKGLPEEMIAEAGEMALKIPMRPGSTRSLNLSTAVAIVLYEAVRQQAPEW
ncbi:MAG: tRNA (cytidine(34)-2'-O)-methyltransferase [Akkermansiaceae bacterium]|jgi:tRNA (cytidine/uridine-2'-O-)-methyltransferase|nr:tRNA (cytidine(34)-2'-O)-methyltransferase [Akkermansiaceae bacterium]MDP4647403.1 tRNA (cytidine(34)-2'-O)-methyltransferase [Akkermansiaceae bacterium]MDP4722140.1 tRNA (cytidine(34)-2'-O)-methyltransferase [Akkermansiaceae bacterium]MDP4781548.1 tRNA (cytidine(34)-2'-O)-methyltransferase [Akkermansiaceae bacterium]MDP4848009.1 tRNA (cytidine(34)-2'-O)-methyltransferase [Akkermansiaceae bacterium]